SNPGSACCLSETLSQCLRRSTNHTNSGRRRFLAKRNEGRSRLLPYRVGGLFSIAAFTNRLIPLAHTIEDRGLAPCAAHDTENHRTRKVQQRAPTKSCHERHGRHLGRKR